MNLERFSQIIEAYGASESSWPSHERRDAKIFLSENVEAQNQINMATVIDDALNAYSISNDSLPSMKRHLMSMAEAKPKNLLDQLFEWIIPTTRFYFWRPLLTATLPLIIGAVFGLNVDTGSALLDDSWDDSWDDELVILGYSDSDYQDIRYSETNGGSPDE